MKTIVLYIALLMAACGQSTGPAKAAPAGTVEPTMGTAYFFGFDAERITGIPEEQIEEYGCLFEVRRDDFLKSLLPNSVGSGEYNRYDVRAKVLLVKTVYFVDHAGIVAQGKDRFLIDKKLFQSVLKPLGKCPPDK